MIICVFLLPVAKKEVEMRKGLKQIMYVCSFMVAILFLLGVNSVVLAADNAGADQTKITGYYYDPTLGKLLPKYGNLSPKESEDYLNRAAIEQKISKVTSLSYKQFSKIAVEDVQYLTVAQIQSIPNVKQFNKLSEAQRAALTPTQVQAINVKKISISNLTETQRDSLSQVQINQVKYADFKYVPVSKVNLLTAAQIKSIPSAAAFDQLSGAQIQALDKTQVKAIKAKVYNEIKDSLTAQQIAWRKQK